MYFSDSTDEFRQLSIREFVVASLSKGDRSLGMDQTKQTDAWEWARANRPATGYGPDETDQRSDIGQSEQTRDCVWARRNRPKIRYGPDETDRCLGIGQTEQTEDWVWTRRNRPMFGYWLDRTCPIQVWARENRPNFGMGQTERRDRKFIQTMSSVAPEPLSAAQVCLAHTCLRSRILSWVGTQSNIAPL